MKAHLGTRIRELRENAGLSQTELAQKIGVHESTISRYEAGLRDMNFATMQSIAKALKISVHELIG